VDIHISGDLFQEINVDFQDVGNPRPVPVLLQQKYYLPVLFQQLSVLCSDIGIPALMQKESPGRLAAGIVGSRWRFSAFSETPEVSNVNFLAKLAFQFVPLGGREVDVQHLEQRAIHAVQEYLEVAREHYRSLRLEFLRQGVIFPLDSQCSDGIHVVEDFLQLCYERFVVRTCSQTVGIRMTVSVGKDAEVLAGVSQPEPQLPETGHPV
jgi:hypothetical protein